MPRFNLIRPFFQRLSSRHSTALDSTSDTSTNTTPATTPASSPNLRSASCTAPHASQQSSSLAKLSDRHWAREASTPQIPPLPLQQEESGQHTGPVVGRDQDRSEERPSSVSSCTRLNPPQPKLPRRSTNGDTADKAPSSPPSLHLDVESLPDNPLLLVEEPTPEALGSGVSDRACDSLGPNLRPASGELTLVSSKEDLAKDQLAFTPATLPNHSSESLHLAPDETDPRNWQSNSGNIHVNAVRTVLDTPARSDHLTTTNLGEQESTGPTSSDYFTSKVSTMANVQHRKIWVKRPNASATLVQIREDDLVDDVRDMILRKYANSLGKTFDAPDMTLRIVERSEQNNPRAEHVLGPEEEIGRMIDTYYPGGQRVDEALLIDVPQKRTPKPSPRNMQYNSYQALDDYRPHEGGNDYFPPMPAIIQPSLPPNMQAPIAREHHHSLAAADHPRSMTVLSTGQVPPLPSPGGRRHRSDREHRPKYGRQHTSSPTVLSHTAVPGTANPIVPPLPTSHLPHRHLSRPRLDSNVSEHPNGIPAPPPLPSPPASEAPSTVRVSSNPPTPSGTIPSTNAHRINRPRKPRRSTPDKPGSNKTKNLAPQADGYGTNHALPNVSSMLDASVPPINVLIVEDNIINLRVLEGLMKRLKVRWETAMNGQIALDKWRSGRFHLVLMDIQMPVMNGLEATKEIRRLESVNGIGVFSSSSPGNSSHGMNGANSNGNGDAKGHDPADDQLTKSEGLFKSPVIIVALTASSLQSDRHEALAAGCNDFLTKPVSFVWLERKVKEWGCMQALIDFDGWRKWKDYAAKEEANKTEEQKQKEREKEEKEKIRAEKMALLQEKQRLRKEEEQKRKEEERAKHASLEVHTEDRKA